MPLLSALAGLAFLTSAPQLDLIDEADIRRDLTYLASERLEGRMTASRGERLSAAYLADQVRRAGLQPFHGNSFFWDFPVTVGRKMGKNNQFSVNGKAFRAGSDFVALQGSQQEKVAAGDLVWVGGGVVGNSRNDYGDLDVKGKIVVTLRGPESNSSKARTASERGAIGIVFIGPQIPGGELELPRITGTQGVRGANVVAVATTAQRAQEVTGRTYEELLKLPATDLGRKATLRTDLSANEVKGRNVIAVLPGNDPRFSNQYIIFGAHHDHLGYAETGSRTGVEKRHLGADDNGSGSVAILEIARYFAATKQNRRPIIFQWYSGEEMGLLGSAAWVRGNEAVLKRTTLMINLDMVGRVRDGKLSLFGSELTKEMPSLLDAVNVAGLTLERSPLVPPNSDHASFVGREVPAVHAFSGLHAEYHTESDTIDTINFKGLVDSARAMATLGLAADKLDFQMLFRKPPSGRPDMGSTRPTNTARRVRTGFMPDMAATGGRGMLIQGTIANSPAAKAGVRAGDRLVKFGSATINSVEDLQAALVQAQPNVPIKVVILREGKEIELTITPEAASPQG